jgi:hypothetical protein
VGPVQVSATIGASVALVRRAAHACQVSQARQNWESFSAEQRTLPFGVGLDKDPATCARAAAMGAEERKLVQDTGAFLMNVLSAVAIIFVNKKLMSSKGYGFNFGGWCAVGVVDRGSAVRVKPLDELCEASRLSQSSY